MHQEYGGEIVWILPRNMEYPFVADTVDSIEDLSLPGLNLESSAMWRSKPSLLRTWSQRWKRVYWFRLLCGRILKPSRWSHLEEWILSRRAIPASHSPALDSEKEQTIQDTSGLTYDESTRQYTLDGCFSRTSKDTLRLDSPQSSATWKKMVTELSQDCLQRQKSAHRIDGNGCLFWQTASVSTGGHRQKDGSMTDKLDQQVRNWRTPAGSDGEGGIKAGEKYENAECPKIKLRDQVHHQKSWPTPTNRDHKDGTAESCQNVPYNGLLGREVHNTTGKNRGSLNPEWVEQLMGLPHAWTDLGSWATESFHSKPQEHTQF